MSILLPPAKSKYARHTDDLHFIRTWLHTQEGRVMALYVGTAYGEDLYSWLGIGLGTPTTVSWTGIEIRRVVADYVRDAIGKRAKIIHGDILEHSCKYNFIIASHVWDTDAIKNKPLLMHLLTLAPLVIAQGALCDLSGGYQYSYHGAGYYHIHTRDTPELTSRIKSPYFNLHLKT